MNNNGASILSPGEITDLPSLVTKLNQPSDEVSQYLIGRFSEATRELLSAYILWLESEIDLGHYDVISRLPGLRQPTLPMYSPSAKPLRRRPSPSLLKKNLRYLLKKKGVYYSDVAVATGFPRTTISRAFMYGNAQATMIPVFSNFFSVGIEDLLTVDLELAEARQPRDGTLTAMNLPAQEATAHDQPPAAKQDLESGEDQDAGLDSGVIARNLKSLLFEQNLTLLKLARLSGICQQDIYKYAKEERSLAPPALSRIAQALQVSEAELLNPARNNVIVDPGKVIANLKSILAHHGCSLLTYANRLTMGCSSVNHLLERGDISPDRAHKIARAERISVRQLVSEDVSHLFPAKPKVDPAVLSRNLRSLCWEQGLSPNEIALISVLVRSPPGLAGPSPCPPHPAYPGQSARLVPECLSAHPLAAGSE